MSTKNEDTEQKPEYKPELWRKMSDEGHVNRGKCPCGTDHEMIDRSDKKPK